MIIPKELTLQLEKLITILNNCGLILSKDKFRYNEDQVELVNLIKFEFEELIDIKIDTFLANVKNNNLEKSILNGLNKMLSDYLKIYHSKFDQIEKFSKSILIESILTPYQFDEKVKILEDDIIDIQDEKNKMPKWLKDKETPYFAKKLQIVKFNQEKDVKDLSWVLKDYYGSVFLLVLKIENKIDAYFPSENLEMKSDFFKREFISELYHILKTNDIINFNILTFENLYLILNEREPKESCVNSINEDKRTLLTFPLKKLSMQIKLQNKREFWLNFVSKQLGLKVSSIRSHGHKNIKFNIFCELFKIKKFT